LRPSADMCGENSREAFRKLARLERATRIRKK
jgi:hypothetical protein